jgi:hypothetical protein
MKEDCFYGAPSPAPRSTDRFLRNTDRTFGEIGMRPRINVVLTPEEQRTYVIWSRGVVTAVVLLAVAVVAVPLLQRVIMAPVSVVAAQER